VGAGEWREHFCLANSTRYFEDEDAASKAAEADLNEAFTVKSRTGSDAELALFLKSKGYVKVDDFQRAKD
jgi:hypothetical protein